MQQLCFYWKVHRWRACVCVCVPVEGWPVGHWGNFPEPGVCGCWAEPPPGPCGSPPAAASLLLPPAPEPPPSPGSAANTECKRYFKSLWYKTSNILSCLHSWVIFRTCQLNGNKIISKSLFSPHVNFDIFLLTYLFKQIYLAPYHW